MQALELTRLACERPAAPDDGARWGAREIVGAVARQLGNTPAVCRKAYIHPEVLALGSRLDDDAPQALAKAWRRSTGGRPARGLLAAEARLLAFMRACRGGRLTGARSARSAAAPGASSRGRG